MRTIESGLVGALKRFMFFWVVANSLLLLGISELEHNQSWSQEGGGGIRAMSPTNAQKGGGSTCVPP